MREITYLLLVLQSSLVFCQDFKADSLLGAHLEQSQCVGMVAGFMDGQERWILSDGRADVTTNRRMMPDTRVRIASVSKVMTATAIMQLVEGGKVQLDEKASTYLGDFPTHLSDITVRHLLDHSSGIRGYESSKERRNSKAYPTLQDAFTIFAKDELVGLPGEQFSYSTYGYVVLGLIIEEVSGVSYEAYMESNLFDPLGMENTGNERYEAISASQSEVYHKNAKGKVKKAPRPNLSDRIPGGGFYSTVDDMLTFGSALMTGKLIAKSSLEHMMTDSGLKQEGNPYGLGLYLYGENPKYGHVVGHSGTQLGASVQLMLLPEKGIVTFVASNTSGIWEDVFELSVLYMQLAAGF